MFSIPFAHSETPKKGKGLCKIKSYIAPSYYFTTRLVYLAKLTDLVSRITVIFT